MRLVLKVTIIYLLLEAYKSLFHIFCILLNLKCNCEIKKNAGERKSEEMKLRVLKKGRVNFFIFQLSGHDKLHVKLW